MENTEEYYSSLDKRTNEYKEWKLTQPSEGLGDTIEKITKATGIKTLVQKLFGKDCGCDERQAKLNKLFKYKPKCLTELQYIYLKGYFDRNHHTIGKQDIRKMIDIYRVVVNNNQEVTTCPACIRRIVNRLKEITDTYTQEVINE